MAGLAETRSEKGRFFGKGRGDRRGVKRIKEIRKAPVKRIARCCL
jgi:hypothetical protein